jgi:hypothetical protein
MECYGLNTKYLPKNSCVWGFFPTWLCYFGGGRKFRTWILSKSSSLGSYLWKVSCLWPFLSCFLLHGHHKVNNFALPQAPRYHILSYHMIKNNEAKWWWIETLKPWTKINLPSVNGFNQIFMTPTKSLTTAGAGNFSNCGVKVGYSSGLDQLTETAYVYYASWGPSK